MPLAKKRVFTRKKAKNYEANKRLKQAKQEIEKMFSEEAREEEEKKCCKMCDACNFKIKNLQLKVSNFKI